MRLFLSTRGAKRDEPHSTNDREGDDTPKRGHLKSWHTSDVQPEEEEIVADDELGPEDYQIWGRCVGLLSWYVLYSKSMHVAGQQRTFVKVRFGL